ncbi:hypothetical protein IHN63_00155 [Deinococcus sp. 6YEL10]|uniref:hypothetical protein n=1 Tax=Deinococcus sp. 6YEL10 TaxID=2745870 RepID=UPI001E35A44F|nr:hypothetical protein [Deinococcus sp. 6YEL10]MCD0159710.1 hypothetical protein [Deinococcus sp. 6YEL10]
MSRLAHVTHQLLPLTDQLELRVRYFDVVRRTPQFLFCQDGDSTRRVPIMSLMRPQQRAVLAVSALEVWCHEEDVPEAAKLVVPVLLSDVDRQIQALRQQLDGLYTTRELLRSTDPVIKTVD